MNQSNQFRRASLQLNSDQLRLENLAPLHLDRPNHRAGSVSQFGETLTKVADDAHDDLIAGFDEIEHDGFEPACSCRGDRNRVMVGSAEERPQVRHGLLHDGDEVRVEVAHQGSGHGGAHLRMRIRWAGAQQKDFWGIERGAHGSPRR